MTAQQRVIEALRRVSAKRLAMMAGVSETEVYRVYTGNPVDAHKTRRITDATRRV